MNNHLSKEQVSKLNEKHGWFQSGDAQSDVSRAFAQDAINMYERQRAAAPLLLAALKTARSFIEGDTSSNPEQVVAVLDVIDAALAAAEAQP